MLGICVIMYRNITRGFYQRKHIIRIYLRNICAKAMVFELARDKGGPSKGSFLNNR